MDGFYRLISLELTGTGLITLQSDELLGMIMGNTSVAGAGDAHIYEDNAAGRAVAHLVEGQTIRGPFEHQSKKLWYVVVGAGFTIDIYAWKNADVRRSQF